MPSMLKYRRFAFVAGILSCALIGFVLWPSRTRPSIPGPVSPSARVPPTEMETVSSPHDRRSNGSERESGADRGTAPVPQLETGVDVLRRAKACMRPDLDDSTTHGGGADAAAIWQCLQGFDWMRVTPVELGEWLCVEKLPFQQACRVLGSALYARSPKEALAYLSAYQPTCLDVRETGLQIMAVESIGLVDPKWVAELERSMTPDALFTGDSSTQALLLAELFIRNGNGALAVILENGGRGEYGGSKDEISRAAAASLFVISSGQWDANRSDNAWVYAESLLTSPTTPPIVGNVLGAFLTNKQTWPGGDSTPAMSTLLVAMDDTRFTASLAATLFYTQKPAGPVGCNKVIWDEVYAKVLVVATKNGWEAIGK